MPQEGLVGSGTIEVRVEDVALLFDPLDPFPLPSRDLARSVEAFILDWARELPREAVRRIVVHVPRAQRAPYFRSLRALARRCVFASGSRLCARFRLRPAGFGGQGARFGRDDGRVR